MMKMQKIVGKSCGSPFWLISIEDYQFVVNRMKPEVWAKEEGERIKQRWQYLSNDHEMHVMKSLERVKNAYVEMPEQLEELLDWYLPGWRHYVRDKYTVEK